jgi:hypothetical protein
MTVKVFLKQRIEANKTLIYGEAQRMGGFMRLLMKQRNTGEPWTPAERSELKSHLLHLAAYVPVIIIFLMPLGSLLIPLLAEVLDRRKGQRTAPSPSQELSQP